jgi:hypothetical protein
MRRVVGHLLLLRARWTRNLLHVGRLMGRWMLWMLRIGGVWRGIVGLSGRLRRLRLVRRLGVRLVLVVLMLDHAGSRVVLWMMSRRWQALRRVGVMHVARSALGLG